MALAQGPRGQSLVPDGSAVPASRALGLGARDEPGGAGAGGGRGRSRTPVAGTRPQPVTSGHERGRRLPIAAGHDASAADPAAAAGAGARRAASRRRPARRGAASLPADPARPAAQSRRAAPAGRDDASGRPAGGSDRRGPARDRGQPRGAALSLEPRRDAPPRGASGRGGRRGAARGCAAAQFPPGAEQSRHTCSRPRRIRPARSASPSDRVGGAPTSPRLHTNLGNHLLRPKGYTEEAVSPSSRGPGAEAGVADAAKTWPGLFGTRRGATRRSGALPQAMALNPRDSRSSTTCCWAMLDLAAADEPEEAHRPIAGAISANPTWRRLTATLAAPLRRRSDDRGGAGRGRACPQPASPDHPEALNMHGPDAVRARPVRGGAGELLRRRSRSSRTWAKPTTIWGICSRSSAGSTSAKSGLFQGAGARSESGRRALEPRRTARSSRPAIRSLRDAAVARRRPRRALGRGADAAAFRARQGLCRPRGATKRRSTTCSQGNALKRRTIDYDEAATAGVLRADPDRLHARADRTE